MRFGSTSTDRARAFVSYTYIARRSTPSQRSVFFEPSANVVTTDRKSTRLNSSHIKNSYAVFCLKQKIKPVIEAYRSTYQEEPDILAAQAYDAAMMVLTLLKQHKDTPCFFNDAATTEIYTLSLHDALPI